MIRFVLCGGIAGAASIAAGWLLFLLVMALEHILPRALWEYVVAFGVTAYALGGIPLVWWGVYLWLRRLSDGVGGRLPRHHREGGGGGTL